MRHTAIALVCAAVVILPAVTHAQGRTDTRSFTCAALKAIVDRTGRSLLATSATAYEMVYRDAGACEQGETGAPAFEPTIDVPTCFAGWRCKQRNTDGNQAP